MISITDATNHMTTKILMQQSSVGGIKVSMKREFWQGRDDYDTIPEVVTGKIFRWLSKAELTMSIDWYDGRESIHLRQALRNPWPSQSSETSQYQSDMLESSESLSSPSS